MAHPGGRPSSYDPEWCEELITTLAKGETIKKFCSDHEISKSMFHRYVDKHPEFRDAYEKAEQKRDAFWEKLGYSNIENKSFNANLYKFLVFLHCGICEKKEVDATLSQKDESIRAVKQAKDVYL